MYTERILRISASHRIKMKNNYFSGDTLDILRLFEKYRVRYVIVGGEAVIFYGYSRITGDIDFFYDNSEENAVNIFNAMTEFWDGNIPGINSAAEFMEPGSIIQFGQPPNRIDLINRIDGIDFNEAWDSRNVQLVNTDNVHCQILYIGIGPLIKNKKASGRYKDLDDLRFLSKLVQK